GSGAHDHRGVLWWWRRVGVVGGGLGGGGPGALPPQKQQKSGPPRGADPAFTARPNVNVALAKYWAKRDPSLNLPATGSISVTLDGLSVEAQVGFGARGALPADEVTIDGEPARGAERDRLPPALSPVPRPARPP